jgi:hypothetical protein
VDVNSTMWTDAPAGFSGPGSLGMTSYACPSVVAGRPAVRLAPTAAPVQGTGLPVAARLRPIDEIGTALGSAFQQDVIGTAPVSTTHNFTTPLGIQPPGRPQS